MNGRRFRITALIVASVVVLIAGAFACWHMYLVNEVRRRAGELKGPGFPEMAVLEEHCEWFSAQVGIDDIIRREILNRWRDDPEYACILLVRLKQRGAGSEDIASITDGIAGEILSANAIDLDLDPKNVLLAQCIDMLIEVDPPRARLALLRLRSHPVSWLRGQLPRGLRKVGLEEDTSVLMELAEDSEHTVARAALETLAAMRCRDAIPLAKKLISQPDVNEYVEAEALELVIALGEGQSPAAVRESCLRFATKLEDTTAGSVHADYYETVMRVIVEALVESEKPDAWRALLKELRSRDDDRLNKILDKADEDAEDDRKRKVLDSLMDD